MVRVHKVFWTHRLAHSQTDRPECSRPPAPFFSGAGGIKRFQLLGIPTEASPLDPTRGPPDSLKALSPNF